MIAGKVWGTTQALLLTPGVEIHRLALLPNAWCSTHRHAARWNAFYVLTGRLYIEVHQRDYKAIDTTVLEAGDLATVAPGLFHRMRTDNVGASALEIYYPAPLGASDIERRDVGGRGARRKR